MPYVVVSVPTFIASTEKAATEKIHHALNGCYDRGEIVFECEGLKTRNIRLGKEKTDE